MAVYADIHIKVDPEVKSTSEKILGEIGISMSDLINMTLREMNRRGRIPFQPQVGRGMPANMRVGTRAELETLLDECADYGADDYIDADEFWADFRKTPTGAQIGKLAHA